MDILISSNLERLLYHITNDATKVKSYMEKLQSTGCYQVDEATFKAIQEIFSAGYLDDSATKKCIHDIYQQDNYVACLLYTSCCHRSFKAFQRKEM